MNTDQGSQFTSIDFIKALKDADIQISMDDKGAWCDNVLWNGSGGASHRRRSTCAPMTAS